MLASHPRCRGPAPPLRGDAEIGLVGLDEEVRAAIDERSRKGEVIALHLEHRACNMEVHVLACTRPVPWLSDRPRPETLPAPLQVIPTEDLLGTDVRIAGAGNLYVRAHHDARDALAIERRVDASRRPSWLEDLRRSRAPARWGEVVESVPPPLGAADLRGPDCAKATHYATRIDDGAYAVRWGDTLDGPWSKDTIDASKAPPIAIEARALRGPPGSLPSSFPPVPPPAPAKCPLPAAGQMTEQAAQGKRLFDAEKYMDAIHALYRVAKGDTGDDEGNRQIAEYYVALAFAAHGHLDQATEHMKPIATSPCHLKRGEAAFWLAVRDRRATF
ncbi:MAG: hypothetical protein KIT84_03945 [Labilithrix sp.]|nr:hypothetical protein [Labilithrix sp.]MCW5810137.1 hypothetical protein [Labilithrix sp.]